MQKTAFHIEKPDRTFSIRSGMGSPYVGRKEPSKNNPDEPHLHPTVYPMLSASYFHLLLLPAVLLAYADFRTRRVGGAAQLVVFGVTALAAGGFCEGWLAIQGHGIDAFFHWCQITKERPEGRSCKFLTVVL